LQEQVTALQASLIREKHQVACLTDELKKKQEMHRAPPKFATKLSSVSLVPTVSSSRAIVGTAVPTPLTVLSSRAAAVTLVPASFKTLQPMPSSSQVMIDLTKEEDHNDVLDRHGTIPDYDMELGSDEELLKGEALDWLHTLASIPKGAKWQGRVQSLACDEIEAELSELRRNYMACDASHGINDPALQELETVAWTSYRLRWQDFGHVLRQANAGVKFPKWSQCFSLLLILP
jgi:hypothetical protein